MFDICSFVGIAKVGTGEEETGIGDVTCGVAIVEAKSGTVLGRAKWVSKLSVGVEAAIFV